MILEKSVILLKAMELDPDYVNVYWGKDWDEIEEKQKKLEKKIREPIKKPKKAKSEVTAPEAAGFITPTLKPLALIATASPAVTTVLPTSVSVPVINKPLFILKLAHPLNYSHELAFLLENGKRSLNLVFGMRSHNAYPDSAFIVRNSRRPYTRGQDAFF